MITVYCGDGSKHYVSEEDDACDACANEYGWPNQPIHRRSDNQIVWMCGPCYGEWYGDGRPASDYGSALIPFVAAEVGASWESERAELEAQLVQLQKTAAMMEASLSVPRRRSALVVPWKRLGEWLVSWEGQFVWGLVLAGVLRGLQ